MQIGALSKILYSNPDAKEFSNLRQTTDRIVRAVAAFGDEKTTPTSTSSENRDLKRLEDVIEQVSDAYKQVSLYFLLSLFVIVTLCFFFFFSYFITSCYLVLNNSLKVLSNL